MTDKVRENRRCNQGYYSDGTRCLLCTVGQWSDVVGVTACKACTNAPNGTTYYLGRVPDSATTLTNACPW